MLKKLLAKLIRDIVKGKTWESQFCDLVTFDLCYFVFSNYLLFHSLVFKNTKLSNIHDEPTSNWPMLLLRFKVYKNEHNFFRGFQAFLVVSFYSEKRIHLKQHMPRNLTIRPRCHGKAFFLIYNRNWYVFVEKKINDWIF